jgi:hypothetical protein
MNFNQFLQLQGEVRLPTAAVASGHGVVIGIPQNAAVHYRGIMGTIATISREEGFRLKLHFTHC